MTSGERVDNNLITISTQEGKLIKILSGQIRLDVKEDDGYVTISSDMPEAIASAEMTLKVQQLLQQYVINFKIQNQKNN